jgi:putative nucleotidyltransferase with HDIG domain
VTEALCEEALLKRAFRDKDIKEEHQENVLAYLRVLKLRDQATYRHSIRVGLLAEEIAFLADEPGITPKMLLWSGLLHDIGKSLIPSAVLTKTSSFSPEDVAAMEPHVRHGWDMLNQVHDYTANIIVRHHQFGPRPYPAELPLLPEHLKDRAHIIDKAARLLTLADYYDAMMHRKNDKFGGVEQTPEEKQEKYIRDNQDQSGLVAKLIYQGVLSFS